MDNEPLPYRELHVHPHPSGLYQGEIYVDGAKVGRTGLVASIDAAKRVATHEYGEGLTVRLWSQDDAIILI